MELTYCYFCLILLANASHMIKLIGKGWKSNQPPLWGELQSHVEKEYKDKKGGVTGATNGIYPITITFSLNMYSSSKLKY